MHRPSIKKSLIKPTLPTKSFYKVFVGKVGLTQEGYVYDVFSDATLDEAILSYTV